METNIPFRTDKLGVINKKKKVPDKMTKWQNN